MHQAATQANTLSPVKTRIPNKLSARRSPLPGNPVLRGKVAHRKLLLSLECPHCKRGAGQYCHDEHGYIVPAHRERLLAALKESPLLRSFLTYLRTQRDATQNTTASYETDVMGFAEWFKQPLPKARRKHVIEYIGQLLNDGVSARTCRRHLLGLRHFYLFLIDEGKVKRDPTRAIPFPKTWKRLPKSISPEDLDTMVASLGTSPLDIRDRAMLLTLFASGLRESELANLKLADLHLDSAMVKVWEGKGGKDGIVPLSPPAIAALKEYLQKVRPGFNRDGSPVLFLGRFGWPLTRQQIFYRIRKIGREALGKAVGVHQLRHGFATALVEGGADIRDVQALMRHATVDTTSIYIHTDLQYLRRTYNASHPRARFIRDQNQTISQLLCRPESQPEHNPGISQRPAVVHGSPGTGADGCSYQPQAAAPIHG